MVLICFPKVSNENWPRDTLYVFWNVFPLLSFHCVQYCRWNKKLATDYIFGPAWNVGYLSSLPRSTENLFYWVLEHACANDLKTHEMNFDFYNLSEIFLHNIWFELPTDVKWMYVVEYIAYTKEGISLCRIYGDWSRCSPLKPFTI